MQSVFLSIWDNSRMLKRITAVDYDIFDFCASYYDSYVTDVLGSWTFAIEIDRSTHILNHTSKHIYKGMLGKMYLCYISHYMC